MLFCMVTVMIQCDRIGSARIRFLLLSFLLRDFLAWILTKKTLMSWTLFLGFFMRFIVSVLDIMNFQNEREIEIVFEFVLSDVVNCSTNDWNFHRCYRFCVRQSHVKMSDQWTKPFRERKILRTIQELQKTATFVEKSFGKKFIYELNHFLLAGTINESEMEKMPQTLLTPWLEQREIFGNDYLLSMTDSREMCIRREVTARENKMFDDEKNE